MLGRDLSWFQNSETIEYRFAAPRMAWMTVPAQITIPICVCGRKSRDVLLDPQEPSGSFNTMYNASPKTPNFRQKGTKKTSCCLYEHMNFNPMRIGTTVARNIYRYWKYYQPDDCHSSGMDAFCSYACGGNFKVFTSLIVYSPSSFVVSVIVHPSLYWVYRWRGVKREKMSFKVGNIYIPVSLIFWLSWSCELDSQNVVFKWLVQDWSNW